MVHAPWSGSFKWNRFIANGLSRVMHSQQSDQLTTRIVWNTTKYPSGLGSCPDRNKMELVPSSCGVSNLLLDPVMNLKKARWPIVIGLVLCAMLVQFGRSRIGPAPPVPGDLTTIDPQVAKLIQEALAHVQGSPGDLDRWVLLGKVYEANALHDVAASTFEQVLAKDPSRARIWFRFAVCNERLGDLDQAIAAMEQSIQLDPEFGASRWRQSMWLADVGQLEKAAARADEAIELNPNDESAWFAKARVLLAQRKNEEAMQLIGERNLEASSNGAYAKYLLGTAYRQSGQLEQASGLLGQSQNFRPVWRDDWSRELSKYHTGLTKMQAVASNLVKRGQFQEAIPVLQQVVAADPTEPRSLNLLGMSLLKTQQYEQSLSTLEKSLANNPDHFASNVNYAAAAIDAAVRGHAVDLELALQRADKAVELRADSAGAHEARARLLKILDRTDEALMAMSALTNWTRELLPVPTKPECSKCS